MKRELKNNVNTLLWLMVTLSVMMMFLFVSLLSLSSCNSSVSPDGKGGEVPSPDPGPGPKTVKITVIAPKEGGSIKVDGEVLKETKEFTPKVGDTMTFEAVPDVDYYAEWNTVSGLVINEDDPKIASLTVASDSTINLNSSNPMKKVDFEFIKKYISFNKDSDIVYDVAGLGFGKKDGDELYYLTCGYNPDTNKRDPEYGNVVWTAKELKSRVNMEVPNLTNYIGSSLDIQWESTKQYKLEESTVKTKYFSKSFKIADGYRFAIKMNKSDSALYVLCSTSGWIYFADWQFVFVDKSDSNKGYTFRFGEYDETLKKGTRPYILVDCKGKYTKEKSYKYAPGLTGPMYCKEAHEFKLSDIFQDTLNQKLKMLGISLSESQKNKLMSHFVDELLDPSVYNAYVIVDAVFADFDNGYEYINTGHINNVWKHVLKLTDSEFWNKCFKE